MKKIIYILCVVLSPLFVSAQAAFQNKIENLGYEAGVSQDWSDSTTVEIAEPTCAYINITGISKMPTSKYVYEKARLEFFDGKNNYLRKKILIKNQGNSSRKFPKTSFAVEFCEDDWEGEETTDMTIGSWVPQDSYHFKAYYYDTFKGIAPSAYKLYQQVTADRGEYGGRAWERSGLNIDKLDKRAICHPDGFPVIVYLNGNFYGIYVWQLKKNRKNLNLKKNKAEMPYLDGASSNATLFYGTINWHAYEVRNPKNLYSMDGTEYDGDKRIELIDETSPYFDLETDDEEVKAAKERSALTKKYIQNFSKYHAELTNLKKSGKNKAEMREEFEKRYDVISLIDYWLFSYVTDNYDGFNGNWQWFSYDGVKWFIAPYDLDCTFGLENYGNFIYPPEVTSYRGPMGFSTSPYSWINSYYSEDLKERYHQLRDKEVFDTDNIMSILESWVERIGPENYEEEWDKWPDSPCHTEQVLNENWSDPMTWSNYANLPNYSATETYHAGDRVRWNYKVWEATGTTIGVAPCSHLGYTDNFQRVREWIDGRIDLADKKFGYTPKLKMMGDVNHDEIVDISDVLLVVDNILGRLDSTNDFRKKYADMNGDGIIDISDVLMIVDVILGSQIDNPQ